MWDPLRKAVRWKTPELDEFMKKRIAITQSVPQRWMVAGIATLLIGWQVAEAGPGGHGYGGGVTSIAESYVIRLQERVKQADEAALRGTQLMADGDYQGAIDQFHNALDLIRKKPIMNIGLQPNFKKFR